MSEPTTSELADFFGLSRAGVIKVLRAEGVRPVGSTRARSKMRWPREAAVHVLATRARRVRQHAEARG